MSTKTKKPSKRKKPTQAAEPLDTQESVDEEMRIEGLKYFAMLGPLRPMLGNGMGGISGPAIKPIALRCVHQVASAVSIPIIGISGIENFDNVMQFLVAGASAVQIGTANYYDPTLSTRLIEQLPDALAVLQATSVSDVVGSLRS